MKRNEQKIENTWRTEDIFKDVMKRFIDGFEEFETIKASSKSLSSIYNDLYYLSKREKRVSEISNINLVRFLSSRLAFFDEMANVKNTNFSLFFTNDSS